uniref:Putative secreted protein n=1 Tax=Ixodes ricinus TaxID=34613 RepID=A0A6B0V305_IXORI
MFLGKIDRTVALVHGVLLIVWEIALVQGIHSGEFEALCKHIHGCVLLLCAHAHRVSTDFVDDSSALRDTFRTEKDHVHFLHDVTHSSIYDQGSADAAILQGFVQLTAAVVGRGLRDVHVEVLIALRRFEKSVPNDSGERMGEDRAMIQQEGRHEPCDLGTGVVHLLEEQLAPGGHVLLALGDANVQRREGDKTQKQLAGGPHARD